MMLRGSDDGGTVRTSLYRVDMRVSCKDTYIDPEALVAPGIEDVVAAMF